MTLNEFQQLAYATCLPESGNFASMMLNLTAEVGEFASQVSWYINRGYADIDDNHLHLYSQGDDDAAWDRENDLRKEAGDVLRQLSGLCTVMGWDLEDIARQNLNKLADL